MGPRGARRESLSASWAMFIVGGALTMFAVLYDRMYANAAVASLAEAPGMPRPEMVNMVSDSLFILIVPVAALFFATQTILLRQIRKSVSVER